MPRSGEKKPIKEAAGPVGRALEKQRSKVDRRVVSHRHTTHLDDGSKVAQYSVTELSNLSEFLETAELADREFTAERRAELVISSAPAVKVAPPPTKRHASDMRKLATIPRRPYWDLGTTADALHEAERTSFLEWRRSLVSLEEDPNVSVTPFEKNLEFWRQLWRVLERSDVVFQIVDARNPLIFFSEDLVRYVKELPGGKRHILLVNKSDFLTADQRAAWRDYFTQIGVEALFWSATVATAAAEQALKEALAEGEEKDTLSEIKSVGLGEVEEDGAVGTMEVAGDGAMEEETGEVEEEAGAGGDAEDKMDAEVEDVANAVDDGGVLQVLGADKLISFFDQFRSAKGTAVQRTLNVGMVGYPNVGKSSTINALLGEKKVPVSANPGRTKHFQTIQLDESTIICDCPGLVLPSITSSREDMVTSGILSLHVIRDVMAPVALLCSRVSRQTLEEMYGFRLPPPAEYEDPGRPPTATELLNCLGFVRGFMTANGQPDNTRAGRLLLTDYICGKLLYCHAPPGVAELDFNPPETLITGIRPPLQLNNPVFMKQAQLNVGAEVDAAFFGMSDIKGGTKNRKKIIGDFASSKRHNKGRKEKLKKIYGFLDQ